MIAISRNSSWLLLPLLLGGLSGCDSHDESSSAMGGDTASSEFVQNLSGRFAVSIAADNQVTLRYEAPDGIGLTNVDLRAVPVWHLQSVLDGMQAPTNGVDVHWDSLSPSESRAIDLGEPPQLNDGVTSVTIEGTAELQGRPVRFAVEQRR